MASATVFDLRNIEYHVHVRCRSLLYSLYSRSMPLVMFLNVQRSQKLSVNMLGDHICCIFNLDVSLSKINIAIRVAFLASSKY